ncbi:MAG: hypothetical protein K2G04_05975 [Oscillospiraceae bacterium]|nr:hypothetical protein [Oscillospiraceae bacterium]
MKAKKAINKVAEQEGLPVEEIRKEMQIAIDEGLKSTEPQAVEFWKGIPHKGEKPTPEEFIDYISKNFRKQL